MKNKKKIKIDDVIVNDVNISKYILKTGKFFRKVINTASFNKND